MNTKKVLSCVIVVLVSLAVVCWFYIHMTRYVIVSQKTYGNVAVDGNVTRGYGVRSADELKTALSKYGVAEPNLDSGQGAVNFDKEFVFIVENGSLLEISHGFSGFDIAAIKPSTNLSIAVVRGPKHRSLQAVSR